MPRPSPYTDKQKSAILEAVKAGRKSGKKWPEIHAAATEAGFKGGLQYLMKMARKSGAVRGRRRRGKPAAAATTAKRKPGRPMGSKNAVKRGPGRPRAVAVAGNGAGLAGIEAIVERMVEQRVGAKIGAAVRALEIAAGELRGGVATGNASGHLPRSHQARLVVHPEEAIYSAI